MKTAHSPELGGGVTPAGRASGSVALIPLPPHDAWRRTLVVAGIAAVLAFVATRIFASQPAAGGVLLGALAMAAAVAGVRPGVALVVGAAAAVWNDLIGLPHAFVGFLGPALVIELWAAYLRARPAMPLRRRITLDLSLMALALGSPVAIGFAAGPGYVDLRHHS